MQALLWLSEDETNSQSCLETEDCIPHYNWTSMQAGLTQHHMESNTEEEEKQQPVACTCCLLRLLFFFMLPRFTVFLLISTG